MGNGQTNLDEYLAMTDLSGTNKKTFNTIENDMNSWKNGVLQEDLKSN